MNKIFILPLFAILLVTACSDKKETPAQKDVAPYIDTTSYDGDEKAVQLVNTMLENLGGKQSWAEARTTNIRLKGDYVGENVPWTEIFWIDLQEPRGRYEIMIGDKTRIIAWSGDSGWELDDSLILFKEDRMNIEKRWWKGEPNVIYHRLAKGFPKSRLAVDSISAYLKQLHILDAATGDSLCWFILNRRAEPVRWGLTMNGAVHDHVLGPLTDYDKIRFVKWGATKSAAWRYEHLGVSLSKEPPAVSFTPPDSIK